MESFGVGDVVCALPALRALRETYPAAEITLLTSRTAVQFCAGLPFINHCEICPHSFTDTRQFLRRWRPHRRETLAVLLNDGWWHNLCIHLLQPQWTCGYLYRQTLDTRFHPARLVTASWTSHRELIAPNTHLVQRSLCAATPALAAPIQTPPRIPELASLATGGLPTWLTSHLDTKKTLILCHPGTTGKARQWPTERWREILTLAAENLQLQVLLTGGGGDEEELCADLARGFLPEQILSVAGRLTLAQEANLLQRAKCFVGPDCGPAHLASAVGCATVILMGPTHPETSAPYWEPRTLLSHGHDNLISAFGEMEDEVIHPSMLAISVAEVWQAISAFG